MGGFKKARRQFVLRFEDEELQGLEVRATSCSLGKLMGLLALADMGRKFSPEDVKKLDELFALFTSCVKEWNLEHEEDIVESGEVVDTVWVQTPRSIDGLKEHDPDFVLDMVFAWMDGVVGTSVPLERRSEGGKPSEEELIPMETLSESPMQ